MIKFILKTSTLTLALCMTMYAIYLLNQGHTEDFFNSLGYSGKKLSWCSNRLIRLESTGAEHPWVLEEKDNQWVMSKSDAPPEKINYLKVEKWLAKYCSLKVHLYKKRDLLDKHLMPFAKAYFNDETTVKIYLIEDELYQINEVTFVSEEMDQAIKELKSTLSI